MDQPQSPLEQPHPTFWQEARALLSPVHKAGWPIVAAFAAVTAVLSLLSTTLGYIGIVLTAWCAYFFRDPFRVTPLREGLIVSPADGVVHKIIHAVPPNDLGLDDMQRTRITINLNIFDVHVNRIPVEGSVTKLTYVPGKFLNASLDKSSEENERQLVRITLGNGQHMGIVQIAGLVARRIVCDLTHGQPVKAGEKFGIIRFGSRVDVYLPLGQSAHVVEGQRVIAGETVLADLHSEEPNRIGIRH